MNNSEVMIFINKIVEHLSDTTEMSETERQSFAFRIWLHKEWLWDFLKEHMKEDEQ